MGNRFWNKCQRNRLGKPCCSNLFHGTWKYLAKTFPFSDLQCRIWHWPLSPWELQLGASKNSGDHCSGSFLPNIWHTGGKRQKRQHCHQSQGWNVKLYIYIYVAVAVFVLSACGPIVWLLWLAVDACFLEAVKSLEAPKWQLWNGTPTGWWWVVMDIFFDLAFGSSTWNTFKENSDIPFWHNLYALSTCLWRKSFSVWIFGILRVCS